jgi:lipoprotein signal peptidase
MKKKIRLIIYIIGGFLFLLDIILKYLSLFFWQNSLWLTNFLGWQPTTNHAGVFSLPVNNHFILITSFPLLLILIYFIRAQKANHQIRLGLWLILLGALSNTFDRLFWDGVIDYLFIFTGVVNLADGLICAGGVLIFLGLKKT